MTTTKRMTREIEVRPMVVVRGLENTRELWWRGGQGWGGLGARVRVEYALELVGWNMQSLLDI